jgi:hypothetical protein
LKSDQFGFSVPKTENDHEPKKLMRHPYVIYYENKTDKEKALKNIVNWVYKTRSIGGSFLWPEEEGFNQPPYI